MRTITDVIRRVTAEHLEIPRLRLKTEQLQRLCGNDPTTCQAALCVARSVMGS
jgi:hypothetical protein